MGFTDLAKVVAYESDEGTFLHPRCYQEQSRTPDSKWRRLGMAVMERLHTSWPKGARCAICGGDSKIVD